MKVVLKASILDEVHKRIAAAKRERRIIEHIIVTDEEYAQLRHECFRGELDMGFSMYSNPCAEISLTVNTIELDDPDARHDRCCSPRRRFLSREKLMGYDLYVVPARFLR